MSILLWIQADSCWRLLKSAPWPPCNTCRHRDDVDAARLQSVGHTGRADIFTQIIICLFLHANICDITSFSYVRPDTKENCNFTLKSFWTMGHFVMASNLSYVLFSSKLRCQVRSLGNVPLYFLLPWFMGLEDIRLPAVENIPVRKGATKKNNSLTPFRIIWKTTREFEMRATFYSEYNDYTLREQSRGSIPY